MKYVSGTAAAFLLMTAAHAGAIEGEASLSEWLPMSEWAKCAEMTRPGVIFELRNLEGMAMFAPCAETLPQAPWDWQSPPLRFRAVVEAPAEHSTPIPAPRS